MHVNTRVTVRARDAELIMAGLRGSGFEVRDTGERITTDEGLDGEHVLDLGIPLTIDEQEHAVITVPR